MTSGERMVWAAEFVASYSRTDCVRAARRAHEAVIALRTAKGGELSGDESAMLDDMLSTGADR